MGQSRILIYRTGLDTKTYLYYKRKSTYLLSTKNIKINLRNQFLAYRIPFLDSQCSSVLRADSLYRSCMFLEAIGLIAISTVGCEKSEVNWLDYSPRLCTASHPADSKSTL